MMYTLKQNVDGYEGQYIDSSSFKSNSGTNKYSLDEYANVVPGRNNSLCRYDPK